MLVFVVLGGLGNIWGSIIAATLLTLLPELLRGLSNYRMLIYAILLIAMMLFNNSSFKVRLLEKRAMRQMEKAERPAARRRVRKPWQCWKLLRSAFRSAVCVPLTS